MTKHTKWIRDFTAGWLLLGVVGCGSDTATQPSGNTGVSGAPAGAAGGAAGAATAARAGAGGASPSAVGAGGAAAAAGARPVGVGGAGGSSVAGVAGAAASGAAGGGAGTGAVAGTGAAGTAAASGSGGSGTATGGSSGGALGGPLTYTSSFTMGMTIPTKNKCPMSAIGGGTGDNKSPALSWKGGSAETKSFAIVLFDTQYNMLHWVLWDIPASTTELPEGLPSGFELTAPAGAHQAANMGSDKHAYYGPCSSGALAGTYEYRLYTLNTDKLAMLTESSTATQAQTAVEAAKIDMAVWSGKPE